MSRPDAHGRAVALIEQRLFETLSLADVAAASGLSAFHFSRLFTALHGESVMAYVRRRRLARAARRLIEAGEVALVELALDCGFESQQAFTRAFTRQFGVSPGRFRRSGLYPRFQPGDPAMTSLAETALESLGRKTLGPFRAAGFQSRFDADSLHAIPALWKQLVPHLPIQGGRPGTLGLCMPGGGAGDIIYLAGVELEPDAAAPEGMAVFEVPGQTYAVYRLTISGEALHPQMQAALRDIWGRRLAAEGLKAAGGPDFELYPPCFDERKAGETVEFWIPVEA